MFSTPMLKVIYLIDNVVVMFQWKYVGLMSLNINYKPELGTYTSISFYEISKYFKKLIYVNILRNLCAFVK